MLAVGNCVSSLPADTEEMVRESFAWLAKHGAINYGALKGADVPPPKPATPKVVAEPAAEPAAPAGTSTYYLTLDSHFASRLLHTRLALASHSTHAPDAHLNTPQYQHGPARRRRRSPRSSSQNTR